MPNIFRRPLPTAEGKKNELRTILWSFKNTFAAVGLFSFVVNLLLLVPAIYMLQIYDRALTSGSVPTLAALSVLHHDQPGWAFPEVRHGADTYQAAELAHPLLPSDQAVANDVEVGPVGRFLFVTGSNMSGKSTLLRAIGLNTVLAMTGGPVAATSMSLPPLDVWTCMRVEDSIAQ